ncbi:Reverse transcriptase domain-containing protein [Caenorhabditis elegans]|uniref:Reverse transcriptase domain-containing protein n=1 Tax=Caenorhabditis elegans TaxID=6239 RepID=Q7KX42_CAEEL|nr:Reverse transcriptase domain-containing protein [Caenorhabditis elegans]CCD67104.1 Reverse transcriptase domain-containing protein [Caenorhabditis elegans]|eukprot:NP_001024252.1 Uncharacterized protein CELE_Y50D4A.5 [Caenorhabditis elegans]
MSDEDDYNSDENVEDLDVKIDYIGESIEIEPENPYFLAIFDDFMISTDSEARFQRREK